MLLSLGIPTLNQIVQNNRLINQTEALVASLKLARHESITKQVSVTLCASDNQLSCTDSSSWQSGWIVFTDAGQPGVVDGADKILQVNDRLENGLTLAVAGEKAIRYTSTIQRAYVCIECNNRAANANRANLDNKLSGFIQNHLPFSDVVAGTTIENKAGRIASSVKGNSEISICDATRSGETGRLVVISMVGRVSVANKICD
jgi:Tfp pilus assembly protein FimT